MKRVAILIPCLFALLTIPVLAQDEIADAKKLLEQKRWEAAAEKFEKALKNGQDEFTCRVGLAQAWLGQEDAESANFHAVKAEKLKPDAVEAVQLVGLSFLQMGQKKLAEEGDPSASFQEAATAYGRCARLEPKNVDHLRNLGWLRYMLTEYGPSADAYEAAAMLLPQDPDLPYSAAQSLLLAADQLQGEEQVKILDRAAKLAEKSVENAKGAVAYALFLSQVQQKKGDKAGASSSLVKILCAPDVDEATQQSASASLYAMHAADKSWDALEEGCAAWSQAKPKSHVALWWLGYSRLAGKKWAEAEAAWRACDKAAGGWAEAKHYLAVALKEQGKTDEALETFKKAGSMNYPFNQPQNSPSYYLALMSGEAFGAGRLAEAARIIEDFLLPICPPAERLSALNNQGLFRRDLGVAQDQAGKKAEARKSFEISRDAYAEAVKLIPKTPGWSATQKAQLLNDLGVMYHYHFDDTKTASKYYREALEADPNLGDACLNMGKILRELGKLDEAEEVLKRGGDRRDIQAELNRVRQARGKN